jgi:hypothetical protein
MRDVRRVRRADRREHIRVRREMRDEKKGDEGEIRLMWG